ncbi:hypothetical protein [Streptomyces europaeiscabiei]|uniref:hypothetical protein n=1 Tax=Streptomyces europaeiscabiei TaxID=146819 RepID=UPI0038F5D55F
MTVKAAQGVEAVELVLGRGLSFREAADVMGLSVSTCWRRYWWVMDWTLPGRYGVKAGRLPPQRGTRACPRGRPWIQELDGPGGPLYQEGIER